MASDYVIVGSGSAGAALAYRLAEAGRSVTIVEAGGSDIGPFIQMPGALSYPMNMARYDWGYESEPEPALNNRRLVVPRGKVLGGSSSVNGMVWVRGHARDFDHWAEQGAAGWSWADIAPYYRRMEHWHGPGASDWRGDDGPMHIRRARQWNPLMHAFVEAGRQAGYPVTEDYNGAQQEGFGAFDMSVHKGRRWSTANAYLRPALKTGRVTIVKGLARRVVIENGRATGVEVATRGGVQVIGAAREVVLSASSINTPKLLMLSGIGPAAHLAGHGIAQVADRPGVGQNLQDHLEVYVQYAAQKPITLYRYWNLPGKALIGAQWLFTRTGHGASNQFESCGFIRSAAGIDYPDIQFHFLPIAVRYDGKAAAEGHGFQIHTGPMRSRSRGAVTLRSARPEDPPEIRFNYMSHDDDWTTFRAVLRLTREIATQPALAEHVKHEIQPGDALQSDDALDGFIRDHAESAFHPCGTARMGAADDPMAVVDPELRVIGVAGLRVADSSVFPRVTNGNTNAPSILVGEKAADHMLGRDPLPRDGRAPWIHPDWRQAQR
ncbi:choline dehydrogenase [Sinisalibacter aestuarii]|uniref:Choline dehydrogenase n=1 Tax=Sinisalibacter aestuarii TaxID=2949426 RepID=A0ABQ5LTM9_9RHOB|nr:choline dehydrogenase [Sinisalibacter aestuarii]GKY88352.1 choline dehydrogenase [Sinisalibacter aestuarii]